MAAAAAGRGRAGGGGDGIRQERGEREREHRQRGEERRDGGGQTRDGRTGEAGSCRIGRRLADGGGGKGRKTKTKKKKKKRGRNFAFAMAVAATSTVQTESIFLPAEKIGISSHLTAQNIAKGPWRGDDIALMPRFLTSSLEKDGNIVRVRFLTMLGSVWLGGIGPWGPIIGGRGPPGPPCGGPHCPC